MKHFEEEMAALSRRRFLKRALAVGAGTAAFGALPGPLMELGWAANKTGLSDVPTTKDRYYIFCYFAGGWDTLLALDPRDPVKFNKRTPVFHNVKLRVQKMLRLKQTSLSVYMEVYNLLNQRDYAYTLFNNANAVARWETYYDDDQTNDVGDPMLFDDWDPLLYRQELIFLKNTPRYFRLGLIIN